MATPCLSTLSWSTLMYCSGTLGIKVELISTGGANAGYRRRREAENSPLRQSAEFLIQSSFYFLILFRSALAIAPGFQRNEEETVVAGVGEAEQIEADNRCRVLNSRNVCENVLYLFPSLAGAFHRRRDRKLHADVEVALIFIRHKAGGQAVAKEKRAQTEENEQHHHEPALANYRVGPPHKTIGTALPIAVECVKEFPERSAAPVAA